MIVGQYITNMLTNDKFGFKTCTHEPCLYYKTDKDNNLMLIVKQVDDLLCCHKNPDECDKMAKKIQEELTLTLTPFQADSQHQVEIQLAEGPKDPKEALKLQKKMGFNYQQAIGELIYAYTICHIDIAIAVITLSQFSHQPAAIHYDAVK